MRSSSPPTSGRIRVQVDREAAARFVAGRAMLPLVLLPVLGLGVALAIVGYFVAGTAIFVAALLLRFLVRRTQRRLPACGARCGTPSSTARWSRRRC